MNFLSPGERAEYLASLGLSESGLDRLIRVGADFIVPNFLERSELLGALFA